MLLLKDNLRSTDNCNDSLGNQIAVHSRGVPRNVKLSFQLPPEH